MDGARSPSTRAGEGEARVVADPFELAAVELRADELQPALVVLDKQAVVIDRVI